MTSRYEIFLQANMLHGYFTSNAANCLAFAPTPACQALLSDYRMGFRNTGNGFVVMAEKQLNGVVWQPVIPVPVGACFNFYIYQQRADFLNITDADFAQYAGGRKYFFRNNAAMVPVTTGSKSVFTLINNTTLVSSLQTAAARFIAPVNTALNPYKLVLRDMDDTLAGEKIIDRDVVSGSILGSTQLFSNTAFTEGIYKLQQVSSGGAILQEDVYFLTPGNIDNTVTGIFQIQYNSAVAASAGNEKHFNVQLAPRKIKWVYRVQVETYTDAIDIPNNIKINQLDINASAHGFGIFSAAIAPADVVTFTSPALIAMQEHPYDKIELIDKGPPRVIISNLPNPDTLLLADAGGGAYKSAVALKIK